LDRVTMEDIAEKAGVSINTVSRALNDKPDINDQTKKEILGIADELNYQPNRFAQGLRSSKTSTLGVIVADIQNPFFSGLLKGIEKSAKEQGYSIIVQDTDENYENEISAVRTMLAEQIDGLLITPVQNESGTIEELQRSPLPFVLLGRYFEGLDTHYVVTDDVGGAYKATEHLINKGHRDITIINGPPHISSSRERLIGYRKAMDANGLPVKDSMILEDAVTLRDGYELAKARFNSAEKPTAIFCYSDFVALGVLQAAREIGLAVPGDLAVVGYDDSFFAKALEVPLTTVRIPKNQLGEKALETSLELINQEDKIDPKQVKLETELVIRAST